MGGTGGDERGAGPEQERFAAALAARRGRLGRAAPGLPWLGPRLRVRLGPEVAPLLGRLRLPRVRVEAPPLPAEADLGSCHKPFQLWNVERAVLEHPLALTPQAPLRVGSAAGPARRGPPWPRERACHELQRAPLRVAWRQATRERGGLRRLLAMTLPFGRPEPAGE